jgi:hypothetical protein
MTVRTTMPEEELIENAIQRLGLDGEYCLKTRDRNGYLRQYELDSTHQYELVPIRRPSEQTLESRSKPEILIQTWDKNQSYKMVAMRFWDRETALRYVLYHFPIPLGQSPHLDARRATGAARIDFRIDPQWRYELIVQQPAQQRRQQSDNATV